MVQLHSLHGMKCNTMVKIYPICHMQKGEPYMSTTSMQFDGSTRLGRLFQLVPELSSRGTLRSLPIQEVSPTQKELLLRTEVLRLVNLGPKSSSEIQWMLKLLTSLKELVSIKGRPDVYWLRQLEEDAEKLVLSHYQTGNANKSL